MVIVSSRVSRMKHLRRMIAGCGLLAMVLMVCVPVEDLPETQIDESDISINVAIPETPASNQTAPIARSIQGRVRNWTLPNVRPERVPPTTQAMQRPSARAALALFCALLC
jgi:hypothetical protein